MQKTTLEQWRMFKAVVEHGGFNQAAQAVYKSQSTVHHAVSRLEDGLGVKLLAVKGRKAELTKAGELLLLRGNYLLDEVKRIESVARSLCSGVETELRIAADGAFPQMLIYQALEQVSIRFPQTKIDIIDTVLSGTNELVAAGKADIGLSWLPMPNGLNEEICQVDFVAVSHPAHPLQGVSRLLTYEDLKGHRQIVVRDSASNKKINVGWLGAEQRWTVSHLRASIELVIQGMGYAWLPLPAIVEQLAEGTLRYLPLGEGTTRSGNFYLNYQDKDELRPAAREFIGHLRHLTLDMLTSTPAADSLTPSNPHFQV